MKNNSKKLWDSIKTVTNTARSNSIPQELLTSKDPKKSLANINEFFVSIRQTLAGKFDTNISPNKIPLVDPNPTSSSFALLPTDPDEIVNIIGSLMENCSPGWDLITAKALKTVADLISPVLSDVFNRCLQSGIFPQALKKSIVQPIHKAGDKSCVNNYRPISMLTSLSKVLERIINSRLVGYLEDFGLLSPSQFGFRK